MRASECLIIFYREKIIFSRRGEREEKNMSVTKTCVTHLKVLQVVAMVKVRSRTLKHCFLLHFEFSFSGSVKFDVSRSSSEELRRNRTKTEEENFILFFFCRLVLFLEIRIFIRLNDL